MKNKPKETATNKAYNIIEYIIISILIFIKLFKIYETIIPIEYTPIFAVVTSTIIMGMFILMRYFLKKASNIIFILIYAFLSFVLLVDSAYFSYFYTLPSVTSLKLIPYLNTVRDSVADVNPMQYMWMLWDIPLLTLYFAFIRKFVNKIFENQFQSKINLKFVKKISVLFILLVFISSASYSYAKDFKISYLKSENIIYHISDIVNTIVKRKKTINNEKYVNKNEDKTKNEKYGIAKGKNVIIIQVEALQSFPIDKKYNGQEVTPFLNSLKNDRSFYFSNYFYQVGAGNTSDAEFAVNNSILASSNGATYFEYYQNDYYGLPYILKSHGYKIANAFHGFIAEFWNREEAYKYQGFDKFYSANDYASDEVIGLGISDKKFLQETVQIMSGMPQPFYSFIVTLSSHHPYLMDEQYCDIILDEKHEDTLFGQYINAVHYVDSALESFFDEMKKRGLYEDSVFVIYGDHFAIANYDGESTNYVGDMLGHDYLLEDMFRVPLIIHIPEIDEAEKVEIVGSHIDVLPTLLNLLGIEDNTAIRMGHDLLNVEDNVVYEQMHIDKGSFITNEVLYYVSTSGIDVYNKAYELGTGKEIPITDEIIEQSEKAIEAYEESQFFLENNLIHMNKFLEYVNSLEE